MKIISPALIEINGLQFYVRPETSDFKAIKEVIIKNSYETRDFKILPNEKWLDFGAHIGAFTILALSKGAKVIAFEPSPDAVAILKDNLALNNLTCNIFEVAVIAGTACQMPFYINSVYGNTWRNSVVKKYTRGQETIVQAINYRDWLEDNICIKMDIEGSEFSILEDFPEDIKIKKLVFEASFDIEPDLKRFWAIIEKLKRIFSHVKVASRVPKDKDIWLQNWLPACQLIYCWNE